MVVWCLVMVSLRLHLLCSMTMQQLDSSLLWPRSQKSSYRDQWSVGANEDGVDLVILTNDDSQLNADIAHVRARVEKNFAWVKNTFQTLSIKYHGQASQ